MDYQNNKKNIGATKMKPIIHDEEEGYFIPTPEKKQLDKILKSYLNNCGDDCNVE